MVQGRDKFIILVMVEDIQVDDFPDAMRKYVKTRTYIDAVNIRNQKDLDLFRKKLQYSMPQMPLKDVPKDDANPAERNENFPPMFNRQNRYREYNRRVNEGQLREVREVQELREVQEVQEVRDVEDVQEAWEGREALEMREAL